MRMMLSMFLIGAGTALWVWGAIQLSGKRPYFWKIHAMGASEGVGSLMILAGALVHSLENWAHIISAMGAVAFWGTAFSFVLARLGKDQDKGGADE